MGGGEVGQVGYTGNGRDGVAQVVHVGQSILQPLLLSVSRPREGVLRFVGQGAGGGGGGGNDSCCKQAISIKDPVWYTSAMFYASRD